LLDGVVDDAFGARVVGLDGSFGLWSSHGYEGVAEDATVLGIVEEGADFSFSG
jgi:hypothetical protein